MKGEKIAFGQLLKTIKVDGKMNCFAF